ncbi:hypothetical protein J2W22_004470 [Sphingomonas kyeonggiensis]|uniref:hypothetical protein n=1 Tax=Sphingomonas kyeonggiensis TaxID=1268553 RepID=UPI00277D1ACB|nr:hypothetical protein [Sphingomonas kyeonggiensis]MDQ0252382.1 hypothetical protein [Sphingomonas kyeonggiensis]
MRLISPFRRAALAESFPNLHGEAGAEASLSRIDVKGRMESTEFRAGRAEGVRAALAVVEALLEAEERKLDLPAPYVTRTARRTRRQAYRNAASRLWTLLNKVSRNKAVAGEIEAKLKRMGL